MSEPVTWWPDSFASTARLPMGSLAVLAKESGHHVTGSDINCYPPISDQLDEMGIDVIPNYDVDQLKLSPDLIVIGNVMTRDTEIIEHILNHGLKYTSKYILSHG